MSEVISRSSDRPSRLQKPKATTFHSAHVPYVQIVIIAPIAHSSSREQKLS